MAQDGEFIELLGANLPADERIILCGFRGDPNTVALGAWRPRPWRPGAAIPFNDRCNVYSTISSFRRATDGTWRRRQDFFAAGLALMVDDVGTKVPREVVEKLSPSAIVETSPGNFQYWYFLSEPLRDIARFDALIRAFIAQRLLGADPGMAGVNRVGRLPGFVNGKAKYGESGYRCALRELNARRYSPEELVAAFGLTLNGLRAFDSNQLHPPAEVMRDRVHLFKQHRKWLAANGMIKRIEEDPSGWIQVRCPWTDSHTDRADTGAAIRNPADENGWYGSFRCHHGHCAGKDWMELTNWIMDQVEEQLNHINSAAAA